MRSIIDGSVKPRRLGDRSLPDYQALMEDWRSLYCSIFGMEIDESVGWFSRPRELTYGIVVAPLVTLDLLLTTLESFRGYGVLVQNGLGVGINDTYSLSHHRDPIRHGTYVVWTAGGTHPDADLMGVRGLEISERKIDTMTIIEYLLFVIHHLVRHNWTHLVDVADHTSGVSPKMLCAGTHNAMGNIPLKYDDGGTFALTIAHPYPVHADPAAGSRRVYADPSVFGTNGS